MGDDKEFKNSLTEAHFCGLPSQSNVYGLCKIDLPSKQSEILVSSLRGKVVSLRFNKTKPKSEEIKFTYIPGDAEIISIDAFNKFHHCSSVVIGVTFTKIVEGKSIYYLNVYSEWEQSADFNLDSIAQVWHTNELNFTPYQLYHTEFVKDGNIYIVFLLSGSDDRVHMFKEDKYTKVFTEVCDCDSYYPEFSNMTSSVTWLQCEHYQDYQKRITAAGYFNGLVKLDIVDTQKLEVLWSWSIEHDSPITSLKLFPLKTDVECPHFVTEVIDTLEDPLDQYTPDFNLLVNSAIEPSVVYRNVVEQGLSEALVLEDSENYDCVLCGCVADVDLDGNNEVIIGTYGQEMLAYKFFPMESGTPSDLKNPEKSPIDTDISHLQLQNDIKDTDTSPKLSLDVDKEKSENIDKSEIENTDRNTTTFDTVQQDSETVTNGNSDVPSYLPPLHLNTLEVTENKESSTETILSPLQFHSGHFHSDHKESQDLTDSENQLDKTNPSAAAVNVKISAQEQEQCELPVNDSNNLDLSNDVFSIKEDSVNVDNLSCSNYSNISSHEMSSREALRNVKGEYKLLWKHSFADPVFAINSMDIAGDGLEELVVLTQKGIHILQHDIDQVADLCLRRLKQATLNQNCPEDVFKQLLSENLAQSYQDSIEPLG